MASLTAAVGLIGAGVSIFGKIKQGKAEEEAAKVNALIAEHEADLVRQGAKLDEFRSRKQLRAFVGQQEAAVAQSGVELTGSPLDVIQDSLANAELEIAIDQFNSEMFAKRLISGAERLRKAGKSARTAEQIRAGSTFLTTASEFSRKRVIPKKTKIGE